MTAYGGLMAKDAAWALAALFVSATSIGLVPILLIAYLFSRARRLDVDRTPEVARASSAGLFVEGGRSMPRDTIEAAFVSPSWPKGAYVRVLRRFGFPVELWTADVEGAHALLAALELDASHVTGRAAGAPPWSRPMRRWASGAALGVAVVLLQVQRSPLALALLPLLAAWVLLAFVPVQHVVGLDGVLTTWMGIRRGFVPIGAIVDVEQQPGCVLLRLEDGRREVLPIAHRTGGAAATIGLQVSLLADRIRSAMRRAGRLDVDASVLARGGGEIAPWLARLRGLAESRGYRAAVQREDLVFVVEDAQRPAELRIAAAVALGEVDPHERARVRIAASSSSIPEVREALEAALERDEERLVRALKRVGS
jgi:hypothetical protein